MRIQVLLYKCIVHVCFVYHVCVRYSLGLMSSFGNKLARHYEWLQINKLSLNIAKLKFMIFQKIDKEMEVLTLIVDNMIIERVKEFKTNF